MGIRPLLLLILSLILLTACGGRTATDTGPQLMLDVTLAATNPLPTRLVSSTPLSSQGSVTPTFQFTSEVSSPLEIVTDDAAFVLVTPTLPPSKTPTQTPTITQTPTYTPTPTITVTATATFAQFPTSVVIPITAVIAQPIQQICASTWFFIEPRPANCPLSAPIADQAVFQTFQNGYMIWYRPQDSIYVFYNDAILPRWQIYRDPFDEGMQEEDPAYANAPSSNLWQPRRGFGMLWRDNSYVRDRIGWATDQWEIPYSATAQTATDGTVFINDPRGGIFSAIPGGQIWARYAGYGG